MFPSSLLARLFVKGSLKNNDANLEMKLKNIIESGTIVGLGPLVIDETTYEPAAYRVRVGEKDLSADQITRAEPLSVPAFAEIRVAVPGVSIAPGEHKITLQLLTREAGKIQFSVTEPLSA